MANTRTVEVIRVGSIGFERDYPGKQIVRLRDLSSLYESDNLQSLVKAKALAEACKCGTKTYYPEQKDWQGKTIAQARTEIVRDPLQAAAAALETAAAVEELYAIIKGKRLAAVNVEVYDQISGAYLGSLNTDSNGTLVLPTDRKFVEVLQWRLAGGGYSDHFNGERAAGTPGLFFYFPCDEGKGTTVTSFPGVSGQQATLPSGWGWYNSGFFARPALMRESSGSSLLFLGVDPRGMRSFQFLWYCCVSTVNSQIFGYGSSTGGIYTLSLEGGYLKGSLAGVSVSPVYGTTAIQSDTWYLIQINTQMLEMWNSLDRAYKYNIKMAVYLGGAIELNVDPGGFFELSSILPLGSIVTLAGYERDGFDEIRHLNRELYASEITEYANLIKNGRVEGKSKGSLGSTGW